MSLSKEEERRQAAELLKSIQNSEGVEEEKKQAAELLKAIKNEERKEAEKRQAIDLLKTFENKERVLLSTNPKNSQSDSSFQSGPKQKSTNYPSRKQSKKILKGFIEKLSHVGKAEGLGDFSTKKFFGGIKKQYSEEDVVNTLFVGTASTTPNINAITTQYPEPWLFLRLIIASVILFYGFVFLFNQSENPNLIPGIIFSGSFAIPISTLVLFFELNIRRNVPFWTVMRVLLAGAILSFFITQILLSNTSDIFSTTGAWSAALLEEPAKLIALIILTRGKRKYPYILNGLLLGAAVGCGFATFESAGYALNNLAIDGVESMISIIQLRGVLSPFMHIIWTAVAGAALWRVQRDGSFYIGLLKKKEFYEPFRAIIICHVIWNSGLLYRIPFYGGYIFIGLIAWILALSLVNLGIKQIADEKAGKQIFKTIK